MADPNWDDLERIHRRVKSLVDIHRGSMVLLRRAADRLQDLNTEINGDMNDYLSGEIEGFLLRADKLLDKEGK